jgi:hypothetical protein
VDAFIDTARTRTQALAHRLLAGDLVLGDWETAMQAELKAAHVAVGIIAHGGLAEMAPSDYGFLGARLRAQYALLRGFANDIASGRQPLTGMLRVRADLYSEASRQTFYDVLTHDAAQAGVAEARRVLHSADHCTGCVAEAARGYVPLGELAPIGSQQCRSRCRCSIQLRRAAA